MRPNELADRLPTAQQQSSEKFTLPVNAARNKAREIIYSAPSRHIPVIENWRQLPNGQIEFTVRRLPAAD